MNPRLRRALRVLLFLVVAASTLLALFYAEEDWRGARAWSRLQRDFAARGESLDPAAFIPPPVPDDQNLAMAPLFERVFHYRVDPRTGLLTFDMDHQPDNGTQIELREMPWGHRKPDIPVPANVGNWMTGHAFDLALCQQYYRHFDAFPRSPEPRSPAEDTLLALTRYAPRLDELAREMAARPLSRFPVNYTLRPATGINLPHYAPVQSLATVLRLRAVAALATGQTADAWRDIDVMLRLRQIPAGEPFLIGNLVDLTIVSQLLQPVWEGLAARRWSADDLGHLQKGLREINLVRGFAQGVRGGERMFVITLAQQLQDPAGVRAFRGATGTGSKLPLTVEDALWTLLALAPRGWYMQNAVVACRFQQESIIDALDPASRRVLLTKARAGEHALREVRLGPYTYFAKAYEQFLPGVIPRVAQIQAAADQAVAACALERYRLDHGSYPASLEALVPAYLDRAPTDVIDGTPMGYRLTGDGRYVLWSVGWDGKDDGGSIEWPADRKWRKDAATPPGGQAPAFPTPVRERGDWVWQYAPAEPPDPPLNRSRLE